MICGEVERRSTLCTALNVRGISIHLSQRTTMVVGVGGAVQCKVMRKIRGGVIAASSYEFHLNLLVIVSLPTTERGGRLQSGGFKREEGVALRWEFYAR